MAHYPDQPFQIMTTQEVAALLRVNPRTVRNLVETEELRAFRVGRQWRFWRRDVDDYLNGKCSPG